MKIIGRFSVGLTSGSPELCKSLLNFHPEGQRWTLPARDGSKAGYFKCELDKDDPRLEQLIAIVKAHGYQIWDGQSRKTPQDILFEYLRKYDITDWEDSTLLWVDPKAYAGTFERNSDGLMLLSPEIDSKRKHLVPFRKFEIGFAVDRALICSDGLRAKLEASGLKRLCFKPMLNEYNLKAGPIPGYWELTSDFILPPMANPNAHEGFYWPREDHYRASDLKSASEFDVALNHEYQWPIVSQRFYQFCVREKLDIKDWRPVRIDPD